MTTRTRGGLHLHLTISTARSIILFVIEGYFILPRRGHNHIHKGYDCIVIFLTSYSRWGENFRFRHGVWSLLPPFFST